MSDKTSPKISVTKSGKVIIQRPESKMLDIQTAFYNWMALTFPQMAYDANKNWWAGDISQLSLVVAVVAASAWGDPILSDGVKAALKPAQKIDRVVVKFDTTTYTTPNVKAGWNVIAVITESTDTNFLTGRRDSLSAIRQELEVDGYTCESSSANIKKYGDYIALWTETWERVS